MRKVSGKTGILFHLLPYLNVSKFMKVIWNAFWKKRDCYLLAIALVINEQNYLEKRIIQNPLYKHKVFYTLEFLLQDLLSFNHILFPFEKSGTTALTGLTLHHFGSLHERIMLGKKLYSLLFQDDFENILHWATTHPHTASRKDYWPDIFNDVDEGIPGLGFKRRLKLAGCEKMHLDCIVQDLSMLGKILSIKRLNLVIGLIIWILLNIS